MTVTALQKGAAAAQSFVDKYVLDFMNDDPKFVTSKFGNHVTMIIAAMMEDNPGMDIRIAKSAVADFFRLQNAEFLEGTLKLRAVGELRFQKFT